MKSVWLLLGIALLLPFLLVVRVSAVSADSDILISELQVRGNAPTGAADQEFVVLYNATETPINLSNWKLQYKSATGSTWNDKITLRGSLPGHGRYLLVSDKYPNPPVAPPDSAPLALDTFNAGLSDSGGHIRVVDSTVPNLPVVHDLLGWGSGANAAEGNAPAPAPAGGKSIKRKVTGDSVLIDTDNNAADFELSDEPTPQADPFYIASLEPGGIDPEPIAEETSETPEPASNVPDPLPDSAVDPTLTVDTPETPPQPAQSAPLPPLITELLPNPAPPASDSTDEYVELYNPNSEPLNLEGYKLQSGNTFNYSYVFGAITLLPQEYRAIRVSETGALLANTSGQARLLDAQGSVVAQTNVYENAADGQAWALINGAWQWTTSPTPNQPNVLTTVFSKPVGVLTSSVAKKSSAATAAKKTTAAKAPAAAKPAVAKTIKAQPGITDREVYEDPTSLPPSVHPGILAGVGVITLLYAGYEYRYDAANAIRRFRRYRSLRRAARTQSAGR